MTKKNNIKTLLTGTRSGTKRYKKTKNYLEARARPGEEKTVTFVHSETENYGLPVTEEVTLIAGVCPCAVCGHEFMWECEDDNCECCTSTCN